MNSELGRALLFYGDCLPRHVNGRQALSLLKLGGEEFGPYLYSGVDAAKQTAGGSN
jgi:hypothetical protein